MKEPDGHSVKEDRPGISKHILHAHLSHTAVFRVERIAAVADEDIVQVQLQTEMTVQVIVHTDGEITLLAARQLGTAVIQVRVIVA